MRSPTFILIAVLSHGCLDRPGVSCGPGVCASGTACVETLRRRVRRGATGVCEGVGYLCIEPERIEVCRGKSDGTLCAGPTDTQSEGRRCSNGICPATTPAFTFFMAPA